MSKLTEYWNMLSTSGKVLRVGFIVIMLLLAAFIIWGDNIIKFFGW